MRWKDTVGTDRAMCVFYAVFAAVCTVVMGWLAIDFILQHAEKGLFGVVRAFLEEAVSIDAGIFVYADLVLAWFVLAVFMVVESRRLKIRHVWAYIVGAPALALAVSFPLFMLVRQLKLAGLKQTA